MRGWPSPAAPSFCAPGLAPLRDLPCLGVPRPGRWGLLLEQQTTSVPLACLAKLMESPLCVLYLDCRRVEEVVSTCTGAAAGGAPSGRQARLQLLRALQNVDLPCAVGPVPELQAVRVAQGVDEGHADAALELYVREVLCGRALQRGAATS